MDDEVKLPPAPRNVPPPEPKFVIQDYADGTLKAVEPPKDSAGADLDTVHGAQRWLLDPKNWTVSDFHVLVWEGNVPYISKRTGLQMTPDNFSLAAYVVSERRNRRTARAEKAAAENAEETGTT
jgi:hypothetical protein